MEDSEQREVRRRLAENVRNRRKQLGLTQEEAARAIGLATRHFQKLEAGDVNATLRTLAQVAYALGVDIAALFSEPPKELVDEKYEVRS